MQTTGDDFLRQQRKIQHVYAIAKTALTFLIVNAPIGILTRQALVRNRMYLLPLLLMFVYVSLTGSSLLGNFILLSEQKDLDKPIRYYFRTLLRDGKAVCLYAVAAGSVLYGVLIALQAAKVTNILRILIIAVVLAWYSLLLMTIKCFQFRTRDYTKIVCYVFVTKWRITVKMIAVSVLLVSALYVLSTYLSMFVASCFLTYLIAIILMPAQKLIKETFIAKP